MIRAARSYRIDNAKGILIFLVVFAHLLWGYRDIAFIDTIVKVIYAFHMPAFIFISGYLTRDSDVIPWKSILFLLVMYAIANGAMLAWNVLRGGGIVLLRPLYSSWYLISLACWRVILPKARNCKLLLPLSIYLALAVGCSKEIDNTLALARTVAFFPFFVSGFLFKRNVPHLLRGIFSEENKKWGVQFATGIVAFALGFALLYCIFEYVGISINDEMMSAYRSGIRVGVIRRLILFLCAFLLTIGLLFVLPNRTIPWLSKIGKNSLGIYAFHRIPTLVFLLAFPVNEFTNSYVYFVIIATLLISLLGLDVIDCVIRNNVGKLVSVLLGEQGDSARVATVTSIILALGLLLILDGHLG